jgi:hypothetical protein
VFACLCLLYGGFDIIFEAFEQYTLHQDSSNLNGTLPNIHPAAGIPVDPFASLSIAMELPVIRQLAYLTERQTKPNGNTQSLWIAPFVPHILHGTKIDLLPPGQLP